MADSLISVGAGLVGAGVTAVCAYFFRRFTETQQNRREIVETLLLQLQNTLESLYYRANNLLDWAGRGEMSDEYFEQTSTFILARFFGHESLLISKGIYAKLRGDRDLKGEIKAGIHRLSTAIGKAGLLYYHRLQLGEMSLDGEHFVTFTTFQDRWGAPRFDAAVSVAKSVLAALSAEDLETIRQTSGQLLERLSRKTGVPSALKLAGDGTSRGPRLTEEPDKRF